MKAVRLTTTKPIRIVGDGLVASSARGEGRFLPVLILDASERPDIDDLIRVHEHLPPGDVLTQWATVPFAKNETLILHMNFIRPMTYEFAIGFNPRIHGLLIDAILYSQGVYILTGREGDTVSNSLDRPKIIAEVPRSEFYNTWHKMAPSIIQKRFRQQGLSRRESRAAAEDMLRNIREMWNIRKE